MNSLGINKSKKETKTFIKQGHTKSWTVPIQKDGFFNTIYIGITF